MEKKELLLVVVIAVCVALLYYRDKLSDKKVQEYTSYLPVLGGMAYGFNTLINFAK